jgi:hypothetical protein
MVGGKGIGFDRRLGGIVWVESSGLSSGLKYGGHQMFYQIAEGYSIPNMGKM